HATRQELLVFRRLVRRADEVPPGNLFVLSDSSLAATAEQDQQAIDVKQNFRFRNSKLRAVAQRLERNHPIAQGLRPSRRGDDRRFSAPRDLRTRPWYDVAKHAGGVPWIGNALHRVCHMLIKIGEKAEPVFSRKISPSLLPGVRRFQAARFTAEYRLALKDLNLETPFSEVMPDAQSANAASPNDDSFTHTYR